MNKLWKFVILIVVLIVLDQLTKWGIRAKFNYGESISIIDGFFNITYVRNSGAAFGLGAGFGGVFRVIFFLMIPVLACFYLVFLIWKTREKNDILSWAYMLIFAGAVGNLIDRFVFGYVVDFLDFHLKGSHFPAFNVADSCITVAAGLLIFDFIFLINSKNKKESEDIVPEE